MNTLNDELDAKRKRDGGYSDFDKLQIEMSTNNKTEKPIPILGDKAIDFVLPGEGGKDISLDDLLKNGPVILNFFRGDFCEYCQLELKALQRSMNEFDRYSASLVGISPSVVTVQNVLKNDLKLTYSILSDVGNEVGGMYGLCYGISDELVTAFEGFGISFSDNFDSKPGDDLSLTIPATFVVDRNKFIVFAFADCDHTQRAEPADIVASLMSLS